jgi:hypothetical protein
MTTDWQSAKEGTLRHWRKLQVNLDNLDRVELLTEINVVNDLCLKAREAAPEDLDQCEHCLAYHQFGGCSGVSLKMSECVAEGRMDDLRRMIDEFVANLENLIVPGDSEMTSV